MSDMIAARRKASKRKKDVYAEVTERILEQLDKGTVPWHKPWSTRLGGGGMPTNLKSKRAYRGANIWILLTACWGSPFWVTYKQARDLGGQVRRGERSLQQPPRGAAATRNPRMR